MSKREYRDYIADIRLSIIEIESFIKGMTYRDFANDRKTSHAVIRCIEIIGEAAGNIPATLKDKYPAVPWKDIIGMRNKIAHEYFGVDYKIVWKTVKKSLPELRARIEELIIQEKLPNNNRR